MKEDGTGCPGAGCGGAPPAEEGVAADARLLAEGWTRRFLTGAERVEEMLELYRSMGLEARAEQPSPKDLGDKCSGCAITACRSYRLLYTRPARGPL